MARALHAVAVALSLAAIAAVVQAAAGGPLLGVAAAVWLVWYGVAAIALPRLAHAAFRGRRTAAARWRYRLLGWLSPAAHDAARVSRAGTYLIDGDWRRALAALDRIDGARLAATLRAAWLNNRAYALARADEADAGAGARALGLADEALALRPAVPAFLHTRGLALLAAGRVDEAIRAFEAVWDAGDLDPALEAERCHDLAAAWERKGHADYAADYRRRAALAEPGSPWADVGAPTTADLGALEQQLL